MIPRVQSSPFRPTVRSADQDYKICILPISKATTSTVCVRAGLGIRCIIRDETLPSRERSMTITIMAITPTFAAEIGDIDLSQPLPPEEVETIKQAFWRYGVLIFPGQELTQQQ